MNKNSDHNNNSSSALSEPTFDHTVTILLVATVVEMLICVATVPLSTINLVVISRTSLLHLNLKVILLCQSTFILMRGLNRLLIDGYKLTLMDPYYPELLEPYRLVHVFTFFNRNCIAHILIIERFMATAMVKTYETQKSLLFTSVWCIIVFAVSFYNTIELGQMFATFASVLSESFMLFLGIAEWVIFSRLWCFNEQRYKLSFVKQEHSLSERYQLSENIRTGKQLTPTLSFHFWMVFASAITAYWSYFEIPGFAYMLIAGNIANGIAGLMIEALMIACHPFLKRDAISTLRRIFVFKRPTNRVHDHGGQQATKCAKNSNRKSIAMRDLINGKALVVSSMRQDIYFDSLRNYWNEGKCAM